GLKTVFCEFNEYKRKKLRPDQQLALEHDLAVVKSLGDKGYHFGIEGHACNFDGSTEYNMMLSHRRAEKIANYFKKSGVKGEMHVKGCGTTQLIVPAGNKEQQAPNRRVEIYAYPPEQA